IPSQPCEPNPISLRGTSYGESSTLAKFPSAYGLQEKGRVRRWYCPTPSPQNGKVCCHTYRSSLAHAPGGTWRITYGDPPARYWPGADTRCRGRPHQQPKDCLICFASSGGLPVRQAVQPHVRYVLLLSQEQITPDVQAQLHQLPLEF